MSNRNEQLASVVDAIGVVTVLYNSRSVLEGFLRSLDGQTYPATLFAVDNASKDESANIVQEHSSLHTLIRNRENLGVAAANNQGIRAALEAGCRYVLLLNNDVEFGPALFTELVEGLERHDATMTAPLMYYFDRPDTVWAAGGKFQPLFGYRCYHLGDGERDKGQFAPDHRVEHAPTCCVLFKRGVFERVGLMDERYFVYHDDTDFMLRCKFAGEKLMLLADSKLWHKVSSLTGGAESTFSVTMGTRNRMFMTSKFLGRLVGSFYAAVFLILYLGRFVFGQDSWGKFNQKAASLLEGFKLSGRLLPTRDTQQLSNATRE